MVLPDIFIQNQSFKMGDVYMGYRKALTFSYDDGIEQDRKLVDIFNHYGMKATFNLNT